MKRKNCIKLTIGVTLIILGIVSLHLFIHNVDSIKSIFIQNIIALFAVCIMFSGGCIAYMKLAR